MESNELSDRECLDRFFRKREAGIDPLEVLVNRYFRMLVAFGLGKFKNLDAAKEIAQETFMRALDSLLDMKKDGKCPPRFFGGWIMRIAANVCSERLRKEQLEKEKRKRVEVEQLRHQGRKTVMAAGVQPRLMLEDPSECIAWYEALMLLPDELRDIIYLRYYAGLPCKEIASQLGVKQWELSRKFTDAYCALRRLVLEQPSHTKPPADTQKGGRRSL